MKEIIDQYAPILEGVETKELKTKIKTKQKQLRLNGKLKPKDNTIEPVLRPLKKVSSEQETNRTDTKDVKKEPQ